MLWQREVTAPDGLTWQVGREVLPWRPRLRWRRSTGGLDNIDPTGLFTGADDIWAVFLAPLLALAVFVVAVVLLGPVGGLLALTLEWSLVLLLLPLALGLRMVLGRPWTVYADNGMTRVTAGIGGWRDAREMVDATVNDIRVYGEPRALAMLSGAQRPAQQATRPPPPPPAPS